MAQVREGRGGSKEEESANHVSVCVCVCFYLYFCLSSVLLFSKLKFQILERTLKVGICSVVPISALSSKAALFYRSNVYADKCMLTSVC